jgi:hypothetical protein
MIGGNRRRQVISAATLLIIGGILYLVSAVGAVVTSLNQEQLADASLALLDLALGTALVYAGFQVIAFRERGRKLGLILGGAVVLFSLASLPGTIHMVVFFAFVVWSLKRNREQFKRRPRANVRGPNITVRGTWPWVTMSHLSRVKAPSPVIREATSTFADLKGFRQKKDTGRVLKWKRGSVLRDIYTFDPLEVSATLRVEIGETKRGRSPVELTLRVGSPFQWMTPPELSSLVEDLQEMIRSMRRAEKRPLPRTTPNLSRKVSR